MLKARIITAAVLLGVFSVALFWLPTVGWVAFITLVAALASWEWGGLMAMSPGARIGLGVAMAVVCACFAAIFPASLGLAADFSWRIGLYFYIPAAIFWVFYAPFWMWRRWTLKNTGLGVAMGLFLILTAWLALIQLRQAGAWALLAVLAVAWCADTGGYFFGRRWGKRKLAPTISPGKTWEGMFGGLFAVILYGVALRAIFPERFLCLSSPVLLFLLVFLSLASVVGDLFESLLKRQAGIKDSSSLLPGHGGVLDRIDSLMSVLPFAALLLDVPCLW